MFYVNVVNISFKTDIKQIIMINCYINCHQKAYYDKQMIIFLCLMVESSIADINKVIILRNHG